MKPEDIKVGSIYCHVSPACKGCRYLGVGKRVMWEGAIEHRDNPNFTNKQLAIIETTADDLGMLIQQPPDCHDGYWDGFFEELRPNQKMMAPVKA